MMMKLINVFAVGKLVALPSTRLANASSTPSRQKNYGTHINKITHNKRLLTHNMLQCHVKGCTTDNFPLKIENAELDNVEADFNPEFIKRMVPKLDWPALVATSFEVSTPFPKWRLTHIIVGCRKTTGNNTG
jgi:hypothetical protein